MPGIEVDELFDTIQDVGSDVAGAAMATGSQLKDIWSSGMLVPDIQIGDWAERVGDAIPDVNLAEVWERVTPDINLGEAWSNFVPDINIGGWAAENIPGVGVVGDAAETAQRVMDTAGNAIDTTTGFVGDAWQTGLDISARSSDLFANAVDGSIVEDVLGDWVVDAAGMLGAVAPVVGIAATGYSLYKLGKAAFGGGNNAQQQQPQGRQLVSR